MWIPLYLCKLRYIVVRSCWCKRFVKLVVAVLPINAIFLWKTTHRHTSYHDMRPHKFINRSREDFSLKRRAYRVKRCSFAEFQKMKMSPSLWRPHQTATHPGCWRPLPRRCKARKSSRRPWAWWRGSAAHFPPIFPCNKYHSTRSARIVDFCALLMLMIMDKIGSQMCTQKYNCDYTIFYLVRLDPLRSMPAESVWQPIDVPVSSLAFTMGEWLTRKELALFGVLSTASFWIDLRQPMIECLSIDIENNK